MDCRIVIEKMLTGRRCAPFTCFIFLRFSDAHQNDEHQNVGNPVTLRFVDLTGNHLPDMGSEVPGSQMVLIND